MITVTLTVEEARLALRALGRLYVCPSAEADKAAIDGAETKIADALAWELMEQDRRPGDCADDGIGPDPVLTGGICC